MTENVATPLSKEELDYFKRLLQRKRAEAEEELDKLRGAQSNLNESDDADYSSITHHVGDVASDTQESELNYIQIERTREYILQINEALERIEDKTYGVCQATGKPIAKGRLEVVPHTRYSIEAKQRRLVKDN